MARKAGVVHAGKRSTVLPPEASEAGTQGSTVLPPGASEAGTQGSAVLPPHPSPGLPGWD